ncbi:MAG: hypothetical protein K2W95_23720 [Candidatus Obscuribacterales bacterium]|nr:hypothetical protein [Candidatus Obscuribacterales bacterium]
MRNKLPGISRVEQIDITNTPTDLSRADVLHPIAKILSGLDFMGCAYACGSIAQTVLSQLVPTRMLISFWNQRPKTETKVEGDDVEEVSDLIAFFMNASLCENNLEGHLEDR